MDLWFVDRHHSHACLRPIEQGFPQPLDLWFQAQHSGEPDESKKCRPSSLPFVMLSEGFLAPLPPGCLGSTRGAVGRSGFLPFFFFASLEDLAFLFAR
jgi:hypothetical protein